MSTFEISDDEMSSFFQPSDFGMGAYGDYDWLRIDLENAKQLVNRGGTVQAARQMALNSYQNFRPANVAEQGWGQELLDSALSYIEASAGGGTPVPTGLEFGMTGMGALGAYGDFAWLEKELDGAKGLASRTGNVDGAMKVAQQAFNIYVGSGHGPDVDHGFPYVQGSSALNQALAYINTFRKGSGVLSSGYSSSTDAIGKYHLSQEDAYRAEREEEAQRLALARSHPWLYSAQIDRIPGGMQVVDTVDRLGQIARDPLTALKKMENILAIAKAGVGAYLGYRAYRWATKR